MTSSTSSSYNFSTSASGLAQITGLSSGIDTASLVDNLVNLEARSQTLIKNRLAKTQSQAAVLQSLNAKLSSLATSAGALAKGTAFSAATASASSTYVTPTVTGTPAPGTLDVSVTQTATAKSGEFVSKAGSSSWTPDVPSGYAGPYSIQLTANGKVTTLSTTDYSAASIAAAINALPSLGVGATVVPDGGGNSHLFLAASAGNYEGVADAPSGTPPTGPGLQLQLAVGTTDGTPSGPPQYGTAERRLAKGSDPLTRSDGQDAAITVNGIAKTSKSNTFTDVVTGLNLTLSNAFPSLPVSLTVTTARDNSAPSTAVSAVVSQIAGILSDISFHTTAPAAGVSASASNGGLFVGDSLLRTTGQMLLQTVSGSVATALAPGQSVADAGITTDKAGVVSVDNAKLTAFLTANPTVAQKVLKDFGTSVKAVADAASATDKGTFTLTISDFKTSTSSLSRQVTDWDARLALRRSTLTGQYTAMETALSKIKLQSDALTQAIKQLNSSKD